MATATTSVSGLVSGLDTSSIITQLMQIEAQPQTDLKTKLTSTQTALSSYQGLNTKFQALLTAAQKVQDSATWGARAATSSDTSVAASATANALSGSLTFTVNQLATSHSMLSVNSTSSLTDTSTFSGNPFTLRANDGTATTITPTDGSLQSLVTAVNNANAGVRAAAVQVSPGQYKLQLSSTTTGDSSTFAVEDLAGSGSSNALGGLTVVQQGQNASIHVGSATAGFDVTSASNTFTDVSPGLTFTVSKADVTSTISVSNDATSISNNVSALVQAANDVLSAISTQTAAGTLNSDGTRTGAGALASDTTIKMLSSRVIQAVTDAVGGVGGKSAAVYGIQSTSSGTLTFDATKFQAAYAADPAGTQAILAPTTGTGVAQRLATVATNASDPVTGSITSTITSTNSAISQMNDDIARWDVLLAQKQTNLQTQFTAMEVALQKLQSQSSWLSSQLGSLSANSSSSSS
jgi:flagellar hook-associated protein 2